MMVHFFFLSPGMASNIFCSRAAITGKAGLLLGCGSQHSSIKCFTSSGITLPNLQMQGTTSRLDLYLSDVCRGRSAMMGKAGLLLDCGSHQMHYLIWHRIATPAMHSTFLVLSEINIPCPCWPHQKQIPSGTASPSS